MRRNYNSEQYKDVVRRAISVIPNLGLGADVIVGFPGETDAAFENTRKLIEEFPFSYLHVFSYSPRRGTEANDYKDDVPGNIKKERNKILTQLVAEKSLELKNKVLNQTATVLIENQRDRKSGKLKGHSDNYIPISLNGPDSLKNRLIPVTLQQVSGDHVEGCVLS
jgi:threonylcarbamoyladenosine tRNA methylthiotransferase MtaB